MKKLFYLFVLLIFVSCQSGTKNQENTEPADKPVEIVETTLNVQGMHCDMCVTSIEKGVNELEGIQFVKASLNDSTALVKFDASKTDLVEIEKAIVKRGYSIKKEL